MNTSNRPVRGPGIVFDVAFALVALLGIAFTVYMLSTSWGASYAIFGAAVAVIVAGLTLARRLDRGRTVAAAAAVVVCLAAIVISHLAELPQEPSPIAALGLAVLVASAIRTQSPAWAATVGLGGLAVVVASWATGGWGVVPAFATLSYLAAVAVGWSMREMDKGRHGSAGRTPTAAALR